MVLTNYECWANVVGDNSVCDITLQQAQTRSQIDLFNPRTLNACGIAQKERCLQQSASCEISAKVSQISSNGYYGFKYVNNNNDDVAGNGNDVNTNFGNHEAERQHHVFDDNLRNGIRKNELDKTTFLQPKKRRFVDEEFSCSPTMAKRCRLGTKHEVTNSSPLMEPANNMEIDDFEFQKEANAPQTILSPPHPPNAKSFDKHANQNSALSNSELNVYECNKNLIESPKISRCKQELKDSLMYEARGLCKDVNCNKIIEKYKNNETFLEQMFSKIHGSGAYCLQNMDFDERLYDKNDI